METNIDQILRKYTDEVKRHFDIAQEDFTSQVKLIAEQYETIIKRLDGHDQKFSEIKKTITKIQIDIEIMKVDISFIKSSLKQKVDVEEFQVLEKRVAMLEAKSQI